MSKDSNIPQLHPKLAKIRASKDLTARSNRYLKKEISKYGGEPRPFALRYYQVQGMLHLFLSKRFVLGDATGIGKTIQTVAAMTFLWEKNPDQKAVILTTKSSAPQWEEEIATFTNDVSTFLCVGAKKKRAKIRQQFLESTGPSVLIMGYRSMVSDFDEMMSWEGYLLVTDECAAYKNPKTQVHKRVKHLGNQADRMWGLSATIIKNNLMEGWGIYRVVVPKLFGSRESFLRDYCVTRNQQIGNRKIKIIVGYRNEDIKRFREMIDPFFLARSKWEVASELPVLTRKRISIEMSKDQKAK
ncbi:MAG: SNF2-related protein, partial [Bacteroidota bacterium]